MTTEGEQQEAVCGTCGGFENMMIHDSLWAEGRAPGSGHPFIPAPVVPSDDGSHEREEERWLLTPGKWQPEESAPPTPSQDAEDAADADMAAGRTHSVSSAQELVEWLHAPQDAESVRSDSERPQRSLSQDAEGDRLEALWSEYEDVLDDATGVRFDDEPAYIRRIKASRDSIESAICEPYEALVKAVQVLRERGGLAMAYDPSNAVERRLAWAMDDVGAALIHIEESLGGRKDG